MTETYEHLVCEICYSAIGRFEPADIHQPLTGAMFTSVRPRREVPAPFASSLDWEHMRCPMCHHRPFLRRDRVMTAHPSCFETPGQGPYYLLVEPPAETAKTVKSTAQPKDAAQPAAQPVDAAQASTSQASMAEPDSEEANGPVTCPVCGKQYTSAASLARYHTPCPQATADDEGNL